MHWVAYIINKWVLMKGLVW